MILCFNVFNMQYFIKMYYNHLMAYELEICIVVCQYFQVNHHLKGPYIEEIMSKIEETKVPSEAYAWQHMKAIASKTFNNGSSSMALYADRIEMTMESISANW